VRQETAFAHTSRLKRAARERPRCGNVFQDIGSGLTSKSASSDRVRNASGNMDHNKGRPSRSLCQSPGPSPSQVPSRGHANRHASHGHASILV
jgi:hypothetical protein